MAARKTAASKATARPAAKATTTRRSARLAPPEVAAGPDTTRTRVEKKKAPEKPKKRKYDCTSCGRDLAASAFPKHLFTDNCATHHSTINTCRDCTRKWITAQLDSVTYDKIKCPECPEHFKHDDVKRVASKDFWARWEEMERRGIADSVPGWRWCMNPRCREGQVHEPLLRKLEDDGVVGADGKKVEVMESIETEMLEDWGQDEGLVKAGKKKPKPMEVIDLLSDAAETPKERVTRSAKTTANKNPIPSLPAVKEPIKAPAKKGKSKAAAKVNEDNICACHACGAKACVPCDRPSHDGETCARYQKRRKRQDENEVKKSEAFIAKECKACPKCNKNIEKAGGCDHVTCTQCREQFCWRCVTSYTVINATGHTAGCPYAEANAVDVHAHPMAPQGWQRQQQRDQQRIMQVQQAQAQVQAAAGAYFLPVPPAGLNGNGFMVQVANLFGGAR